MSLWIAVHQYRDHVSFSKIMFSPSDALDELVNRIYIMDQENHFLESVKDNFTIHRLDRHKTLLVDTDFWYVKVNKILRRLVTGRWHTVKEIEK